MVANQNAAAAVPLNTTTAAANKTRPLFLHRHTTAPKLIDDPTP